MQILSVLLGDKESSIEKIFVDHCNLLLFENYQVTCILYKDSEILSQLPKNINVIITKKWGPFSIFKYNRIINKISPDLIIAHGKKAISNIKKFNNNIPVIATCNEPEIKHLDSVNSVIATNNYLFDFLKKKNLSNKIYLLPNLLNLPKNISYNPPFFGNKIIHIGTIGKLVKKNGFSTFIKCLHILRSRKIKFKASIAGIGPEMENLQNQINYLLLNDIVTLEGMVEDRNKYLGSLDIFCLPTLQKFSCFTLLEAFSHSLPVITTKIMGYQGIVKHDNNCILVPEGEPDAFAFAIERLINEPKTLIKIAEGGYNTLKNNHSYETGRKKIKEIIVNVLNRD